MNSACPFDLVIGLDRSDRKADLYLIHTALAKTTLGRRKQILVAIARGFGVDWWRLRTGQTTAEKLGLKME